jgi:hypothetical protein
MENENIVLYTSICDYYGPVVYRYVGTIDMLEALKLNEIDDTIKWSKKYHPKHFFRTYALKTLDKFQEHGGHMKWEVWTVLGEDNPDWRAKPGTTYYENLQEKNRRKKLLPIAWAEEHIDKWIAASEALPGLYSYSY